MRWSAERGMILNSIISMMGGALVLGPKTLAYSTVVTSRGGSLTTNELLYLTTFETSLGSDLDEFDRLWIHGLGNDVAARTSFVNPTSTIITAVNSPTFIANQGYQGNGSTSYLDTNYNPSTQGVKYTTNNASALSYILNNVIGGTSIGSFNGSSTGPFLLPQASLNTPVYFINNAPNDTNGSGNSLGLSTINRYSSSSANLYKNGIFNSVNVRPSSAIPNLSVFISGLNNNGTYGSAFTGKISVSGLGSSNYNQANLYSAIQALGTSIGWAV
jgi:hypothetical protein